MNILKTLHVSFYEINVLAIFYQANQGHFSHFEKRFAGTIIIPAG
jgi:hypothetical protein